MSATISVSPPSARPTPVLRTEVRPDGVGVITLDDPNEPHNTITRAFGEQLFEAVEAFERDAKVVSIVIRSGKKDTFLAGANLDYVRAMKFAKDAEDASREVGARFAKLARAGMGH